MTAPYLVACLATLRSEFNALDPARDKGADGWIGDAAHQAEVSDHNPDSAGRVLALDIDMTGPWPAPFGDLVESLRGDARLEYVIWNRRIASRSQGWTWRAYSGTSDPHTNHAHFSARHDHTGNTSTATWHLGDFMPLTDAEIDKIATASAAKVWGFMMDRPDSTATPKEQSSAAAYQRWNDVVNNAAADKAIEADAARFDAIDAKLADLDAAVRGGFNPGA